MLLIKCSISTSSIKLIPESLTWTLLRFCLLLSDTSEIINEVLVTLADGTLSWEFRFLWLVIWEEAEVHCELTPHCATLISLLPITHSAWSTSILPLLLMLNRGPRHHRNLIVDYLRISSSILLTFFILYQLISDLWHLLFSPLTQLRKHIFNPSLNRRLHTFHSYPFSIIISIYSTTVSFEILKLFLGDILGKWFLEIWLGWWKLIIF